MSETVLQIERSTGGWIPQVGNVLFDTIKFLASSISYTSATGVITFQETGRYVLYWQVATQTSAAKDEMGFMLSSDGGDVIIGNTPTKGEEVSGFGIIEVTTVPTAISLVNVSSDTACYSTEAPATAKLLVMKLVTAPAFGALSCREDMMDLTVTPAPILMNEPSVASMHIAYTAANAICILKSGTYRIDIVVSGNTAVEQSISLALYINGRPSVMMQVKEFFPVATSCISMTNFLSLGAGDELTLQLSAGTNTTFYFPPIGPGATLSVQQML